MGEWIFNPSTERLEFAGYWQRNGAVLSPVTEGDDIATTGRIITTGGGQTGAFLTSLAGVTVLAFDGSSFDIRAGAGNTYTQNVLRVDNSGNFDFYDGNLTTTGTGRFDGGLAVGNTPIADAVLIETSDTDDPTLIFKTTNTAHQINICLDENATNDNLFIEGQTAGVNTALVVRSQDGETAQIDLFSGPTNRTEIAVGAADNFSIKNLVEDKNIVFQVNDGGVNKTITWDAAEDTLIHSAGIFTFDSDISMKKTSAQGYIYAYDTDGTDYIRGYHDGTNAHLETNVGDIILNKGLRFGAGVFVVNEARAYVDGTLGLVITGEPGSQYNIGFYTGGGGALLRNPVGTTDMLFPSGGKVAIGLFLTAAGGTLFQLEDFDAYMTFKNISDEHTEGGAETRIIFEDHSNTALAQIQASHDGVADDTKGDLIFYTHSGSALTEVARFDSLQNATFAGDVIINGDTYWVGAGSGLPYGSLYAHEITKTLDLTTGVYVTISGADMWTAGLNNNVTLSATNGTLTIVIAGIYKVDWSVSCESDQASQDIDIDLFIDAAEQSDGAARRVLGAANDKGNMGATALLDLAVGEVITLKVKNNTAGDNDIIIYDANINITHIGGT